MKRHSISQSRDAIWNLPNARGYVPSKITKDFNVIDPLLANGSLEDGTHGAKRVKIEETSHISCSKALQELECSLKKKCAPHAQFLDGVKGFIPRSENVEPDEVKLLLRQQIIAYFTVFHDDFFSY